MSIQTLPETKCKDCGNTFRYNSGNSTIKPKYCFKCQNIRDSKKRKEYNQKMLSQSTFAAKNKLSGQGAYKYTIKTKNGKKRLKTPKQRARSLADTWFSRYIRIKYHYMIVDGEVYCQCIVDPSVVKLAKYMDNGHFESRANESTRYYEDNCRPQNRSSNRYSGEKDHRKFGENLRKQIGEERWIELNMLINQQSIFKYDIFYYEEVAARYRVLTNKLLKELNIKKWW